MTILATWVTLQDCVDQQVIVNEKEKFLEASGPKFEFLSSVVATKRVWDHKKDCCREPKKVHPAN